MNLYNFPQKVDYTMKRSTILDQYNTHSITNNNQDRSSASKRSSFTLIHHYPSQPTQHPKTPKSNNNNIPFNMDKIPISNQYYHQSNYINHQNYQHNQNYPIQTLSTNRSQPSINRIQLSQNKFITNSNKIQKLAIFQKKSKQLQLDQKIQQLTQRIQKIVLQVQKHQILLTNNQNVIINHTCNNITAQLQSQEFVKIMQQKINQQYKIKEIQGNMQNNLFKNYIEFIKKQIANNISKQQFEQIQQKVNKISGNFNQAIQLINRQLMDNLNNISEIQTRNRKKQIDKIKIQLQNHINQVQKCLQDKIKKQKEQSDRLTQCSSCQALPIKKIFVGDPILLKYVSKVSITLKGQTRLLQEQQTVYKIDHDGFLLDSQGRYLINSKFQQIKLSADQLEVMREKGIIR